MLAVAETADDKDATATAEVLPGSGLAVERDIPFSVDQFRTLNRCLDNAIADAVGSPIFNVLVAGLIVGLFTPLAAGAVQCASRSASGRPCATSTPSATCC